MPEARERGLVERVISIAGNTRESFTVDETSTGLQYRFVLQGPKPSGARASPS